MGVKTSPFYLPLLSFCRSKIFSAITVLMSRVSGVLIGQRAWGEWHIWILITQLCCFQPFFGKNLKSQKKDKEFCKTRLKVNFK